MPVVYLNPKKPDFFAESPPLSNIRSMDDYAEAYAEWARRSGVYELVQGFDQRVIASEVNKILSEPIPQGIFKGQPRFVSPDLARRLHIENVPYPNMPLSWLQGGTVLQRQRSVAYHQGSSEYGSSQQQNMLSGLGYVPDILRKYLKYVVAEEGEHGTQMAYWLGVESAQFVLAEDLLARIANSEDPELQQPLVEFNPPVLTLPELGHYFDKQDRDGWTQLMCSIGNANALYAGMMMFFLRQERRHLRSGEQGIEWYLMARKIPMYLHLKMELEWAARAYRLHGQPLFSNGALASYQIGSKNPVYPLDGKKMQRFAIPQPGKPFIVDVNPDMNLAHLNGYAVSAMRNILIENNEKRSKMLDDKQRREMREFLEKIAIYVPPGKRKELLESGIIPTAALSWRPAHLAARVKDDDWESLRGFYSDVFGNEIPTEAEYLEYRKLVDITPEDREAINQITKEPGWMVEIEPGSRHDVYRTGPVEPRSDDLVLFRFPVPPATKRTVIDLLTYPQAVKKLKAVKKKPGFRRWEGRDTLNELYKDIMGIIPYSADP